MEQSRALRGMVMVAALAAFSLPVAACSQNGGSDGPGAGESQAQGGEGAVADGLVKDMIDKDLVLVGDGLTLELKDKPFQLKADGTVTGADESRLMMSKATRWRFEDGKLHLCPTDSCDNWSAWTVEPGDNSSSVKGEAYLLTLQGAENAAGEPVTRTVVAVN